MARPGPDPLSVDALRATLRSVIDPASGRDLVAADLVDGIEARDGLVQVSLRTERARAGAMEGVRAAAEAALRRHPGVTNATVVLTAHAPPPPAPTPPGPSDRPKLLAEVGKVIAVASGKGGVGKSTVAVNLAVALARAGKSVGLLDADIHGPSLPRMLGLASKPEVVEGVIQPIHAWGLRAMSIGFMVEEDTAMIWRGPMVMGALEQLMGRVAWGKLDMMVVDMPPGTGDAQLTMAQRVSLAGAVIVSTPQDISLIDARRGVKMFEKTGVPILGLIENMSYFCCPNCGHRAEVFGHGGARAEAARLDCDFLGEIPLLTGIREAADAGTPIVASEPDGAAAQAYAAIAQRLLEKL